MNRQIKEVVSWRIISEFIRRYSGKFTVIETHPCSGQYDCLSIYDYSQKHIIDLNRGGSLHICSKVNCRENSNGGPIESYPGVWEDFVIKSNPKDVLDLICRKAGLDCNVTLPPSNPEILSYRFISTFLNHTVFGLDKWECRNGCLDSSGYSSGIVDDFNSFLPAKERLRVNEKHDILSYPAYRFWFIKKNGSPKLCLETKGTVWDENGKEYNLSNLYKKNRRITEVVYHVAKELLP
jgi:hypothetical protein